MFKAKFLWIVKVNEYQSANYNNFYNKEANEMKYNIAENQEIQKQNNSPKTPNASNSIHWKK